MELDDLKNVWDKMGNNQATTQLDTPAMKRIERKKLLLKWKRIILPELAGSMICIFSAGYIWFHFSRLDGYAYQVAGMAGITLLLVLPVISLLSIRLLYSTGNLNGDYAQQLRTFSAQKIEFCRLQKINVFLCHLLLVAVILLSARIFGRNAITDSKYYFIVAFAVGYIFLLFFSTIVFKMYNRVIKQYEEVLREL